MLIRFYLSPVGWACRIHQLHLWRSKTSSQQLSTTLNHLMVRLGNVKYLFIAITPRLTQTQRGSIYLGSYYGQSGPGSNGNERVLHIPQSSRTEASPLDGLVSYPGNLLGKVLPLCKDAVGVFYSSSQLGWKLLVFDSKYLKPFNCIQAINSNIRNHLTVCKQ